MVQAVDWVFNFIAPSKTRSKTPPVFNRVLDIPRWDNLGLQLLRSHFEKFRGSLVNSYHFEDYVEEWKRPKTQSTNGSSPPNQIIRRPDSKTPISDLFPRSPSGCVPVAKRQDMQSIVHDRTNATSE